MRELIGGEEHRPIVVVDPDPLWADRFADERRRIAGALGERALVIEHVGSTAVRGLAAKPIVDVLVSVADAEDEPAYLPDLLAAGYVLRVREPGHRMVRTPALDVHVHVWPAGDPAAVALVAFRDRLRADPGDRELYERTKRRLAEQEWPTMNHYADAKTGVIQEILGRAL